MYESTRCESTSRTHPILAVRLALRDVLDQVVWYEEGLRRLRRRPQGTVEVNAIALQPPSSQTSSRSQDDSCALHDKSA